MLQNTQYNNLKMDDMEEFDSVKIDFKAERARNDLVSKKLGELLLQGYKMLNDTCPRCECILMQKRTDPVYCVGCEDKDVLELTKKPEVVIQPVSKVVITQDKTVSASKPCVTTTSNATNDFQSTADSLKSKISWATNELNSSSSIRYNIELCELIKAASDALASLKL